jgi:hypothetical protein
VRRSEELEAVDQKSNIDIRRAAAGPHMAAISGLARSLRVSPTGVCRRRTAGVEDFQAGHASSILVTRSSSSGPTNVQLHRLSTRLDLGDGLPVRSTLGAVKPYCRFRF